MESMTVDKSVVNTIENADMFARFIKISTFVNEAIHSGVYSHVTVRILNSRDLRSKRFTSPGKEVCGVDHQHELQHEGVNRIDG